MKSDRATENEKPFKNINEDRQFYLLIDNSIESLEFEKHSFF